MKLRIFVVLVLLLFGFSGLFEHSAKTQTQTPDPISGDWDARFKVGDQTSPATFKLKLDGNKVTGTAESAHTGPGTLSDGSWTDGKLSFTLNFKTHQPIAVTGKVEDDKLVGEFSTEGFSSTWEATRKKPDTASP
jgi:hypothetical protein